MPKPVCLQPLPQPAEELCVCRAVTSANVSVFVKFPCIPGAPGFDASGACRAGMPPKFEATPDLHLKSIQAVSDMCGFGHLKSRTWSAPVQATTPEVPTLCSNLKLHALCACAEPHN